MKKKLIALFAIAALSLGLSTAASAQQKKHFEGITIRYFAGGHSGDSFASILTKGAKDAARDLGCKVDVVFSGWDVEKMVDQLREAIAVKPDGIAMMGHPGDDMLMPLIEEAKEAGIEVCFQNVNVPKIRERFGTGYVGAELASQGRTLGEFAVKNIGLKKGDRALVIGPWGKPGRYIREEAVANALKDAGLIVDKIELQPPWATDPMSAVPTLAGYVGAHPDVKLICYGWVFMGETHQQYMEALGKKPGEINCITFDFTPGILKAFESGYMQVISDQLPYLQGYMPVLQLCLSVKYKIPGLYIDTGAGVVTADDYAGLEELVEQGIR